MFHYYYISSWHVNGPNRYNILLKLYNIIIMVKYILCENIKSIMSLHSESCENY